MRRALLVLLLPLVAATAPRDDPTPIDRVEEDWELVVLGGDVPAAGPQVTTTMRAGAAGAEPDINFNLNYREGATFRAGGLQVEVFRASELIDAAESGTASLQTDDETITWTQRLTLDGGRVTYRVESGQSTTWGPFGGQDLEVAFPSAAGDLGDYSAASSASRSGVGWQGDHVSSLKLLRVRYYSGGTLVRTDDAARVAHPSSPE